MPEPAVKSLFSGGSRGMKPGHVILFFLPEKTITAKLKIFNKFLEIKSIIVTVGCIFFQYKFF